MSTKLQLIDLLVCITPNCRHFFFQFPFFTTQLHPFFIFCQQLPICVVVVMMAAVIRGTHRPSFVVQWAILAAHSHQLRTKQSDLHRKRDC